MNIALYEIALCSIHCLPGGGWMLYEIIMGFQALPQDPVTALNAVQLYK